MSRKRCLMAEVLPSLNETQVDRVALFITIGPRNPLISILWVTNLLFFSFKNNIISKHILTTLPKNAKAKTLSSTAWPPQNSSSRLPREVTSIEDFVSISRFHFYTVSSCVCGYKMNFLFWFFIFMKRTYILICAMLKKLFHFLYS